MKFPVPRVALLILAAAASMLAADKEILLIGAVPSHPSGEHEHNADVLLLQKGLTTVQGLHTTAILNGAWPENTAIEKADSLFIFCDGSESHPIFISNDRVAAITKAVARGAGLMFYHYATEPPAKTGHEEMLAWIGGFFELNYSVNPIWDANIQSLPQHPITRGVKPFHIMDEWYFNMRFPDWMSGITPILVATPPPEAISQRDGIRLGNADVRSKAGQPQFLAWAMERPDGGRSVGWTGGHYHKNLGDENFRKLVLNALLWITKMDVPANGVQFSITEADLAENLDSKPTTRLGGGSPPGVPNAQQPRKQ